MAGFFQRHQNVTIYVPNLIGYARIACAFYAFAVAFKNPLHTVVAYFLSFVCDELDGRFARMLNQTSTLGAVLDMVTDRLATTGLLVLLCMIYPSYMFGGIALIWLDIFSHWFQMYSTLLVGSTTHKDVKSRSWLVRMYYKHRLFMGFCCICCEVLYLALYLLAFPEFQQWRLEGCKLPALPSQMQPYVPAGVVDVLFSTQGLPVVAALALAALPGVLVKQTCNWAQLQNSINTLVEFDVKKMKKQ